MLPPFYIIEVISPLGETIEMIENPVSLTATRSYSAVGSTTIVIPQDYNPAHFVFNTRLKLWRTGRNYKTTLFGDTIWFLREFREGFSGRYTITAADSLILLDHPLVAYTAQTPYADKTLEEFALITHTDDFRIDNLMRQYVRENYSVDALDANRNNPLVFVEPDRNFAPYGEKSASWQKISAVLSDLARQSAEKGMELFYDMIPQDDGRFMFKVWRDVRGNDRGFSSTHATIFSNKNNDFSDGEIVTDYSGMKTYCYVLGYDTGPSQIVEEVGNADIIRSDPFARIEFTHNESESDVTSVLVDAGRAALFGARPRRMVTATLAPTTTLRYGQDFAYGDRVGVEAGNRQFDCQINAVQVDWQEGRERLTIRLDGSETLWNPTWWNRDENTITTPTPVNPIEPVYVPPEPSPEDYVPPAIGDPDVFYGDIQAYVMWDGAHIYRTWNLMDASPIWWLIDTGITGEIYDCQYVNVDATTIGAWLMTSDAIWWCANIMADTPSWTSKLSLATVVAAEEAAPVDCAVVFQTMFHYWSQPGHLCVATGLDNDSIAAAEYQHAYFWVTEDFGSTWTHVDMDYFLETDSGYTRGFTNSSLYAMNASRNTPTIWCVRNAPIVGLHGIKHVFYSNDLGYTWQKGVQLSYGGNNIGFYSLLNPFPNENDPSYVVNGSTGVSNREQLLRSTDGWLTSTAQDELTSNGNPTGYGGLGGGRRVNKFTFNNDHVIGWFRHTASTFYHILESFDRGVTWALLYNSGVNEDALHNTPMGDVAGSEYSTPNGWPGMEPGSDADETLSSITPMMAYFSADNVVTLIGHSFSATMTVTAYDDTPGAPSPFDEDQNRLVIAPPADTARLVVALTWTASRDRAGGSSTTAANFNVESHTFVGETSTNDYADPAYGASDSGGFEITWDYAFGDWPTNRDSIISDPPASAADIGSRIWLDVLASSFGEGNFAEHTITINITVTEIELDDGTIYVPGDRKGQWAIVAGHDTALTNRILLTLDGFNSLLDKTGNLATLVPSWSIGPADGFSLPKMGPNAEDPPDTDSHILVRVARNTANDTTSPASIDSTDVEEGDTVLLQFHCNEDIEPDTVPSGFTLLPNGSISGTNNIFIYQKIATGAEPATYDFTWTGSGNVRLGLIALYPEGGGTIELDSSANLEDSAAPAVLASTVTTVPYTFVTFFASPSSTVTMSTPTGTTKQYAPSGTSRVFCFTQATLGGIGPTGERTVTTSGTLPLKSVTAAWKRVV